MRNNIDLKKLEKNILELEQADPEHHYFNYLYAKFVIETFRKQGKASVTRNQFALALGNKVMNMILED